MINDCNDKDGELVARGGSVEADDLERLDEIHEIIHRDWGSDASISLSTGRDSDSPPAFGSYWKVEIKGRRSNCCSATIVITNTARRDALKMALRAVTPDPEEKY